MLHINLSIMEGFALMSFPPVPQWDDSSTIPKAIPQKNLLNIFFLWSNTVAYLHAIYAGLV